MSTEALSLLPTLLALFLHATLFLRGAYGTPCPVDSCPDLSDHSLDLSPLTGIWDTVFFTEPKGSLEATEPHFFNVSICGKITSNSQCSTNSSVCYSTGLDTFYNLGNTSTCDYEYVHSVGTQKSIRMTYEFANDLKFGTGNVTITLICGRSLGAPEVLEGDPYTHAIEITWITSAACKTNSELAATSESKCYHVMAYNDNGIKARFVDLQNLIKPEGYVVSVADRPGAKFRLSVCRPLNLTGDLSACNGSMGCLMEKDSHFDSSVSVPLVLGSISGEESNLHMDNGILSVVYSNKTTRSCTDNKSSVKINFLCPTGNENLGPHISFLDDSLCLTVVDWYTSYACGNAAIQTKGCQLTTAGGMTFDLTGLTTRQNITSGSQLDVNGQSYSYLIQICSENNLNTLCPRDGGNVKLAQFDSQLRCKSLGVGRGTLTYADGELVMTYSMGDACHTNFARTSVINFICPTNVDEGLTNSSVTFVGETNCFYEFEWVTDLACGNEVSGLSSCQFDLNGTNTYNFAPIVGTADKNWVALQADSHTACFMINPCGDLAVTDETLASAEEYCNSRKAPSACEGASVCQIQANGSVVRIGQFNLQDVGTIHSANPNVVTVESAHNTSDHVAVIHYVCKIGDLTTPPIFVNVTNEHFYEFHWATFAGCPTGVQVGRDCTVTHQATGFVFNLTSVSPLSFSDGSYTYDVSLCSPLPTSLTHCPQNTSVCQTEKSGQKRSFSLGMANSSLVYEDGTLKVHYSGGSQCKHGSKPKRNTTILFICDNTATTPVINSVSEDYCQYVIEVRTKLACPPSYRATECVFFENGRSYDFSDLGRSANDGNWEARGPDGSTYYINVCQPLNRVAGCNPLASVCRAQTSSNGHTKYTNLGLASSANLTAVQSSGGDVGERRDKVVLKYEYNGGSDGSCAVVTVKVEFVCNNDTSGENGPQYISGGDSSNPCEFIFTWETIGACPVHPMQSPTCQIKDPTSNYIFDLSPLHTPEPSLTKLTYFNVSTPENFAFHLAICGQLDHLCHNFSNATVCQTDSTSHEHVCGVWETQRLRYFDGSLSLQYSGGDPCHHVNKSRSVLINFECDRTTYKGTPRHISEENCAYTFVWPTALACQPRELECMAEGGKYDLRPLLESQFWTVSKERVVDDYHYVIGGCRSLNFNDFPHCPQKPWMGACRWNNADTSSSQALGYIMGDLVEISEGSLKLTYYNGDRCKGGNIPSVVTVEFQCENSGGTGVPVLVSVDETTCTTKIEWVTRYACPRDDHVKAVRDWVITDPVSLHTYNLTTITPIIWATDTQDNTNYNYTVGLAGHNITCPRRDKQSDSIAVCQTRVSDGHNYALGLVDANSTLDYVDGELIVEYEHGDNCHHILKSRRAVVTFDCELDTNRGDFLEVFGENECEYIFHVHTNLACAGEENIGIECAYEGYQDLSALSTFTISRVEVPGVGHAYVSVCQPIVFANRGRVGEIANCPPGAAACLIKDNGKPFHLGKPTSRSTISELNNKNGVSMNYTLGSPCSGANDDSKRYSTTLLLVCNQNVPVGAPEFVSNDECQYVFKWETKHACSHRLPVSVLTKDVCLVNDSASKPYNFTTLVHQNHPLMTTDNSGNSYYIQLCGTSSPSLSTGDSAGCDASNTGICRKSGSSSAQTLIYADHKFVVTSHLPHVVEVVFPSGTTCDSDRSKRWSGYVRLACATGSDQTPLPVFQRDSDCELHFLWQNSSFCVGEESCSARDSSADHVYNLDGLLSPTWNGIINPDVDSPNIRGGSFTMAICRNHNPFSTAGSHCSSPSGVCLHTADGKHINLGHVTFAPEVVHNSQIGARIHIAYSEGDICSGNRRYHTDLYIHCADEVSTPQLWLPEHGSNCSWGITLNSPLACVQNANSTNCSLHTPIGDYNFSSLANTNQTFIIDGTNYSVCLCSSAGCSKPGVSRNDSTNLGIFSSIVEAGSTNGPMIKFTDGDSCGEHGEDGHFKSTIFMECNRTADKTKGHFILQESLSSPCDRFFFWSTPYACLSEEVSCTFNHESTNTLYDFSPLHSHLKPWKLPHGDDTFYINVCGAIKDRTLTQGCSPDTAICLISGGKAYDIGIASTQQIRYPGLVEMSFNGQCPHSTTRSYVSIKMECGISGLLLTSASDCNYHITWKNPYACSDTSGHGPLKTNCLAKSVSSSANFKFFPTKLHRTDHSYNVQSGGNTFYVNLCGAASECSEAGTSISACVKNGSTSQTLQLASTDSAPIIYAEGFRLLYQMSSRDKTRHVSVTIQCLVDDTNPDSPQENSMILDNFIQLESGHSYYYFTIFTKKGCQFIPPSNTDNNNNNGGGGGGGGGDGNKPNSTKKSAGGAAAGIIITLVVVTIITVILIAIFYKRDRRERVMKALVHLVGGKSSEVVRYHKLSSIDRDEETALMGDDSQEEEGSEVESEGEGANSRKTSDKGDKQQSDEEMIDL